MKNNNNFLANEYFNWVARLPLIKPLTLSARPGRLDQARRATVESLRAVGAVSRHLVACVVGESAVGAARLVNACPHPAVATRRTDIPSHPVSGVFHVRPSSTVVPSLARAGHSSQALRQTTI
jgi:hypothetical protein